MLNREQFLTPNRHGPIKAAGFSGFNIDIIASDGYKGIFNIFDGYWETSQ
jgi:hypothetical protein